MSFMSVTQLPGTSIERIAPVENRLSAPLKWACEQIMYIWECAHSFLTGLIFGIDPPGMAEEVNVPLEGTNRQIGILGRVQQQDERELAEITAQLAAASAVGANTQQALAICQQDLTNLAQRVGQLTLALEEYREQRAGDSKRETL